MRFHTVFAALAALAFSTGVAVADAQRLAAQKCALQTGAPGNYNVSNAPGVPHVVLGQGGTPGGVAAINDCLADAYQVQYGARRGAAAVAPVTPQSSTAAIAECDRIRSQNIATGVVATVGIIAALGEPYTASVIGGAAGTVTGIRGVNQRHRNCVANATVPAVDPSAAIYVGCRRSTDGVMSRGTRLCVAP